MEDIFDAIRAATARVSNMHATTDLAALTSDELTECMRLTAQLRHEVDRMLACESAEINQRSRRELGGAGLAKSEGYVNPQRLIAALTGSTQSDARKIDSLGKSLMHASPASFPPEADAPLDPEVGDERSVLRPWFAAISDLMRSGAMSPDRFESLRNGLGDSTDTVSPDALATSAERILDCLHPQDAPELVYRDAQNARAFLNRAGVVEQEKRLMAKQEATVWTDRDGMVQLRASFAPEDGAWFTNTLNLILGPRIGGPRFVHGKAAAAARTLEGDTRTTEQIRASVLVDLLKAGALTDQNAILSQKRPSVQVVMTANELTRPDNDGVAFLEGTRIPVSTNTVARLACDTGILPIVHKADGSPLDLGREVRLFTAKQRVVLAELQGGCVAVGCAAPAAFCEVHHIDHWCEGGKSDINDGVLLCRFHHMQLHNYGHRVVRVAGTRYEDAYRWIPPTSSDPQQTPIHLRFRGVARQNAHARAAG
ncbi:DUF222 domain-containing protein [Agreia sp.]|uniref:HNH endonuclease signature motif containing protein n=1 Tax=Agreia sp. TaxID=1872416 RepID=UPI0035BBD04C